MHPGGSRGLGTPGGFIKNNYPGGVFCTRTNPAYLLYRYLLYRLVQIERPKLCPRLMTNAIPNQYAQIWYRRKAQEKIKRVTWLDIYTNYRSPVFYVLSL